MIPRQNISAEHTNFFIKQIAESIAIGFKGKYGFVLCTVVKEKAMVTHVETNVSEEKEIETLQMQTLKEKPAKVGENQILFHFCPKGKNGKESFSQADISNANIVYLYEFERFNEVMFNEVAKISTKTNKVLRVVHFEDYLENYPSFLAEAQKRLNNIRNLLGGAHKTDAQEGGATA
jgi:hypothetical protein